MAEGKVTLYQVLSEDKTLKTRFTEQFNGDEKPYLREIIFAKQIFESNEALAKCNKESIRNAIINIALTGATLNPVLQQAFLIPRGDKCCLDISYRGLCKIATDSGSVMDISATAVFEGDDFNFAMGLEPKLYHKPILSDSKREIIAAYAIALLHNGIKKFVVLDREKIERARKSSKSGNVWKEHYDEMSKKTAVKLLYKMLPQTERMATAVHITNELEGIAKPAPERARAIEARVLQPRNPTPEDAITLPSEGILCPIVDDIVDGSGCNECQERGSCSAYEE